MHSVGFAFESSANSGQSDQALPLELSMRPILAACFFCVACDSFAGQINLPAESGSPLYVDDWAIPNYRCRFSPNEGAEVYDGADRCALLFTLSLEAGRRLIRVRALYEDDDLLSQFSLQAISRNANSGVNTLLAADVDNFPAPTPLEIMWVAPNYLVASSSAVYVVAEIQGDTRLKTISYEWK
jgi:hypothetical protein